MKKQIKQAVQLFNNQYYKAVIKCKEIEKIKKKKPLWAQIKLSYEEQKAILNKWGICDCWHRYYQYFTGNYDLNYFPEVLFSTRLEPRINDRKIASVLSDKSILPNLFGDIVSVPTTIIRKSYGRYFDEKGNPIKYDKAKRILDEYLQSNSHAIIKPSVDSCSGQGVNVITTSDVIDKNVEYSDNFLVQELVENQSDIKALNPNSLNTMRVMTYICEDQINCAPVVLRMGGGTSHLDNAHAGGIFVGVFDNGDLRPQAFSEYGEKHFFHPYSKIQFNGYHIRGIRDVCNAAIECHKKFPILGMISWDMTIDKYGRVTVIEANMFGQGIWISQIAHGKGVFGENTDKMYALIKRE